MNVVKAKYRLVSRTTTTNSWLLCRLVEAVAAVVEVDVVDEVEADRMAAQ